jgi:hypothetical protein
MLRGVDVAGTQIRRQQLRAAKDLQRQEAVVIVVAVKVPSDLVIMGRIVGGVEVEDQFPGRRYCMTGSSRSVWWSRPSS